MVFKQTIRQAKLESFINLVNNQSAVLHFMKRLFGTLLQTVSPDCIRRTYRRNYVPIHLLCLLLMALSLFLWLWSLSTVRGYFTMFRVDRLMHQSQPLPPPLLKKAANCKPEVLCADRQSILEDTIYNSHVRSSYIKACTPVWADLAQHDSVFQSFVVTFKKVVHGYTYSAFWDRRFGDNRSELRTLESQHGGVARIFTLFNRNWMKQNATQTTWQPVCEFLVAPSNIKGANTIVSTGPPRDLRGNAYQAYELTEAQGEPWAGYMFSCDITGSLARNYVCAVRIVDARLDLRINYAIQSAWLPLRETLPNGHPASTRLPSKVLTTSHLAAIKRRKRVGLCLPAVYNTATLSKHRLVEWLEVYRRLGVHLVTLYLAETPTPYVASLLASYSTIRSNLSQSLPDLVLRIVPWRLPEQKIWSYGQTLAINDCLYRSMPIVDYVLLGDLDEILVPVPPVLNKFQPPLLNAMEYLVTKVFEGQHNRNNRLPGFCWKSVSFLSVLQQQEADVLNYDDDWFVKRSWTNYPQYSLRKKCLLRVLAIHEAGIHHISKPFEEASIAKLSVNTVSFLTNMAVGRHFRFKWCVINADQANFKPTEVDVNKKNKSIGDSLTDMNNVICTNKMMIKSNDLADWLLKADGKNWFQILKTSVLTRLLECFLNTKNTPTDDN